MPTKAITLDQRIRRCVLLVLIAILTFYIAMKSITGVVVTGTLIILLAFTLSLRAEDFANMGPVLMKEMRSRMRGNRTPMLMFTVSAFVVVVGLLILMSSRDLFSASYSATVAGGINDELAYTGRALFLGVMTTVALLVTVLTPSMTAGAIALECEQQTLEFLLLTTLSETNILGGKLLAALSFAGVLVLCALPVAALAFIFGGVAVWQFIAVPVAILLLALCFGAVSLYCSARFRKASIAVAVAYTLCFSLLFIQPIVQLFAEGPSDLIGMAAARLLGTAVVGLIIVGTLAGTSYLIKRDQEQRFRALKVPLTILLSTLVLCGLLLLAAYFSHEGAVLYGNPVTSFLVLLDAAVYNVPFFVSTYNSLPLEEYWTLPLLTAIILMVITWITLRKAHHLIRLQRAQPPKLPPMRFKVTPW